MKIGFVAGKPQKSFECLAGRAGELGHSVAHIPLSNMELSYEGVRRFVSDCQSEFDVIHYYAGLADPIGVIFGEICEEMNMPILNNRAHIRPLVHDKMFQLFRFSEAGLPVPKTEFTRKPVLADLKESLGFPIIAKRSRGTHGTHVYLITEQAQLDAIKSPSQYLFQEYLQHKNDVRVLVLNGKAVCGYQRVPESNDFRANLALGGHAAPLQDEAEQQEVFALAEKAVQAIPHDLAGVDLIRSEKDHQYRLIEINTNPSWYGIRESTNMQFEDALLDAYAALLNK